MPYDRRLRNSTLALRRPWSRTRACTMAVHMVALSMSNLIPGLCRRLLLPLRSSLDREVLAVLEVAEVREDRRNDHNDPITKNPFSTSLGQVVGLLRIRVRINEARRRLDSITATGSGMVKVTARRLRTFRRNPSNDHPESRSLASPTFPRPSNNKRFTDSRIHDLRLGRPRRHEEVRRLTILRSHLYIQSSKRRTATAAASETCPQLLLRIRRMPAATPSPLEFPTTTSKSETA